MAYNVEWRTPEARPSLATWRPVSAWRLREGNDVFSSTALVGEKSCNGMIFMMNNDDIYLYIV